MTNKEAIEILTYMKNAYGKKTNQALDLAIKALEYLDEDDVLAIRIVDDTESEDGTDNL